MINENYAYKQYNGVFGEKLRLTLLKINMKIISAIAKLAACLFFPKATDVIETAQKEKNTGCNNLGHVEVLHQEIDRKKSIEKRIEAQRRERYENGKNNGQMDDI